MVQYSPCLQVPVATLQCFYSLQDVGVWVRDVCRWALPINKVVLRIKSAVFLRPWIVIRPLEDSVSIMEDYFMRCSEEELFDVVHLQDRSTRHVNN